MWLSARNLTSPAREDASPKQSTTEAKHNLAEAIALFCEVASTSEIETRLSQKVSNFVVDES